VTSKSTTQRSHISLQRAHELTEAVRSLSARIITTEEALKINVRDLKKDTTAATAEIESLASAYDTRMMNLKEDIVSQAAQIAALQESNQYLNALTWGPGSHEARITKACERIDALDSHWRQHAKVSMERHQDTRALQTALMDANKRISDLEARVQQLAMNKVSVSDFTQLWKYEDGHKRVRNAEAKVERDLNEWVDWAKRNTVKQPDSLPLPTTMTLPQKLRRMSHYFTYNSPQAKALDEAANKLDALAKLAND